MSLPHQESYGKLTARFLSFGLLAWGGPTAQIEMIRQELVERDRWVSQQHFNRVLAVYQVLPGPEATELCVYFGMLARGRIGGIIAGLAFILPGFTLMVLLAWFYVTRGVHSDWFTTLFEGIQPAVAALVIQAVHRICVHAIPNRRTFGIAVASGLGAWFSLPFLIILPLAGGAYLWTKKGGFLPIAILGAGILLGSWLFSPLDGNVLQQTAGASTLVQPSQLELFGSGLKSGLLTFGGAYTVIPFMYHEVVEVGHWLTNAQFLDSLALAGIIPAPLIIFATFIGYVTGGLLGSVILTVGIFLPAFGFTLIGHTVFEKLIKNARIMSFLDGVTAGVVGLMAASALLILRATVTDLKGLVLFAISLLLLYQLRSKAKVLWVIVGAGVVDMFLSLFMIN